MSRTRMSVLSLAAALVALFATATLASAHVHVASISPADGSVVTSSPAKVVLTADEAMSTEAGSYILVVKNAAGTIVSTGSATLDATATIVSVNLQANLPAGKYTVEYTITAEDGHPTVGTSTFTIQAAAPSPTAPAATATATATAPAASPTSAPTQATVAPKPPTTGTGTATDSGMPTDWLLIAGAIILVAGVATFTFSNSSNRD